MLWWALAGFFLWLGLREIYHGFVPRKGFSQPHTIFWAYVAITLAIAAAFAYTPVRYWHFERFLTGKARLLSGSQAATVHCNTLFDTLLDPNSLAAGHANPLSGQIVLQKPWCGVLMDHLRNPGEMDRQGIASLNLFVHETMHIRGELNEAVTECQAIQRHYRSARLLGIDSHAVARQSGMRYYLDHYQQRGRIGGMQAAYHSDQCAPGKALDENLADSTWNP
ncbi:MAG: hypothetical protein ABWY01_05220 [Pseudoxanthomonas sp.]